MTTFWGKRRRGPPLDEQFTTKCSEEIAEECLNRLPLPLCLPACDTFPFLELPVELQDYVLDFALPHDARLPISNTFGFYQNDNHDKFYFPEWKTGRYTGPCWKGQ